MEALGLDRRQKDQEENVDKSLCCGFHGKKRVRQGSACLGLAILNHFSGSRAWGLLLVACYLVPSDEGKGIVALNVTVHRGGWDGGWTQIDCLAFEKHSHFCLLSLGIKLGGEVPPESIRLQMSKYQKKRHD